MTTNAEKFIERYLSETEYMPTLEKYLITIPPRKLKSDKQLVGVMNRILLRGMLHDTQYPAISSFSIVSDFDSTNITATLIMNDAGDTIDAYAELPQYITRLTTAPYEQVVFKQFVNDAINALARSIP